MATKESPKEGGDVEISVVRRKEQGSDKHRSEFMVNFKLNIIEPLQRAMKSAKFWVGVGTLGATFGGGWFAGKFAPLEDRLKDACTQAEEVRGRKILEEVELKGEPKKLEVKLKDGNVAVIVCGEGVDGYPLVTTAEIEKE